MAGAPDVTRRMLVEPSATHVGIPLIVNSPDQEKRRCRAIECGQTLPKCLSSKDFVSTYRICRGWETIPERRRRVTSTPTRRPQGRGPRRPRMSGGRGDWCRRQPVRDRPCLPPPLKPARFACDCRHICMRASLFQRQGRCRPDTRAPRTRSLCPRCRRRHVGFHSRQVVGILTFASVCSRKLARVAGAEHIRVGEQAELTDSFDVVIVGARRAGSPLAALLASRG